MLKEARDQLSVEVFVLRVYETNDVARRLYEKLGFEEVGRIENGVFQDGEYKDVVIMEKKID